MMFDKPLARVYTEAEVRVIAEQAAITALKTFLAQAPPGSAENLDNGIAHTQALTVKDMAALLRISMPKAYELTEQPGFPVIRVGRKKLISKDMLAAWMREAADRKEIHDG